jgi:valine dehydrogenase (NAD+)
MDVHAAMAAGGHEELLFLRDGGSGLRAVVAIHDTTLGPALGGTRLLPYPNEDAAIEDALRLSRAMTYKNAAAGLDFGGGKAVIIANPAEKSEPLLRAYGRYLETLGGRYVTTTDVGTNADDLEEIARETHYVAGRAAAFGGSGDTSLLTAKTVYLGMLAAVQKALETATLRDLTVAVQGAGKVGWHLIERLVADGAHVVVTDSDAEAARRAGSRFGARLVGVESIYDVDCDVFSPNALGGALNERTIPRLRCRVVCGGANNQLATPEDGDRLAGRGIVYAPDFIVNCGGVIKVAEERHGYSAARAEARADLAFDRTLRVFALAGELHTTPARAAERYAEERIAAIARLRPARWQANGPAARGNC